MSEKNEKAELRHLGNIETELREIKKRTPNPRRAFINGVLQGMGAVVGTILAVALLGWTLSVFGVIPGLGELAGHLERIMSERLDR